MTSLHSELSDRTFATLLDAVPHVVVVNGAIDFVSGEVVNELGCRGELLRGPLEALGVRLDDITFEQLLNGEAPLRVRLGSQLLDRPVRLRRIGSIDDRTWIEVRSLANEFRAEPLLRRSGVGHMLISPDIELEWSLSAAGLLPGDNPINWIELMDPDDMQALGKAIYKVGRDPNLQRVLPHRLQADGAYTMIDTVESAMHDPDLRAVLVRTRLQDTSNGELKGTAPYAGITVSDHMPIGVVVASATGKVLHRNAAAAVLVGAHSGLSVIPLDAAQDRAWMFAGLGKEDAQQFLLVFNAAAVSVGRTGHCTIPSPLDASRWLRVSVSPAAASTVVLTIEDSTELVLAERELHYLATHDALTNLPDRGGLRARLEALLVEATRVGHRTALIFCDLDNFKQINHGSGHHVAISCSPRLRLGFEAPCDRVTLSDVLVATSLSSLCRTSTMQSTR